MKVHFFRVICKIQQFIPKAEKNQLRFKCLKTKGQGKGQGSSVNPRTALLQELGTFLR